MLFICCGSDISRAFLQLLSQSQSVKLCFQQTVYMINVLHFALHELQATNSLYPLTKKRSHPKGHLIDTNVY